MPWNSNERPLGVIRVKSHACSKRVIGGFGHSPLPSQVEGGPLAGILMSAH